jgi:hypothetical protein
MSTSGLLDEQTKTSLGFITPVGGVSQITAGSGISLSPSGGTGVVAVSTTIQPPIIVDFKQSGSNFDILSTFPTYGSVGTFSASYTPPVDGYLQIVVSAYGNHGATVGTVAYWTSLIINGVQYGSADSALMAGSTTSLNQYKANMAFSFPLAVVAGTPYTMSLVASQAGSAGPDGCLLSSVAWMITFLPTTPIPVPVAVMSAPLEDAPTVEEETVAEVAPSVPTENQTQVYWA